MSFSEMGDRTQPTDIRGHSINPDLPLVSPLTEVCLALLQQALSDRQIRAIDLTLGYQWLMRLYGRRGDTGMTMLTAMAQPTDTPLLNDQPWPACSLLLLAGVSASMALARGQVCVDLSHPPLPQWQSWWPTPLHWGRLSDPYHSPLLAQVDAALLVDPACLAGAQGVIVRSPVNASDIPSDVGQGPQFYIARYFVYEQKLAQRLLTLSQSEVPSEPLFWQELNAILEQLFPAEGNVDPQPDWQKVAAATACTNRLSVITGGPGTGKTTTVTKILLALCALAQSSTLRLGQTSGAASEKSLRIALVAPTGKAAARLMESVQSSIQTLRQQLQSQSSQLFGQQSWPWQHIPTEATTIHRLLGMRHGRFIYHSGRPLPYDCLVIDEASMIDLPLMERLLQAVATGCRVIMLGDQDQLASVEAGSVLADITHRRRLASAEDDHQQTDFNNAVSGGKLQPSLLLASTGLQRGLAHLYRSHRFDDHSGIGHLATSVNQGKSEHAWSLFQRHTDIRCFEPEGNQPKQLSAAWLPQARAGYQGYWQAAQQLSQVPVALLTEARYQPEIKALFKQFSRYQILTAVRDGNSGMHQINTILEQTLKQDQSSSETIRSFQLDNIANNQSTWYAGRPIMISRNHHRLGLFNGDIGLTLGQNDQYRVAFIDETGAIRLVLPSRLPEHETAFAFTVHKSQGSEFEVTHCVLGNHWQPVMTRELIYTAVTRAKQAFWLTSSAMAWRQAVSIKVNRASGLSRLLYDSDGQN